MPACPACGAEALEIDIKCGECGAALGATGAQRLIGTVMLGQYELVDVLGQGGMSVVFKGRHKMTEQEVALKILPPELAAHSQVKSRFLEEAKALAALDHPNIVHLYNFGQENGFFVLAMQFVQGHTWERMIIENKRLDWASSCRICVDVLRALEYAHGRGVVHRDMKPSNVLVRAPDGAATVMDFGIAKMTTSTRLTATGQTMGTVRYMSPEQVRGQEVDLRTDIYSLGATLYESLTGDTPFDGNTHFEIMTKHLSEPPKRPSSLGIEVPRLVEDALMRSLAKRADDRFESARDLRKILEAALREADLGLVETQRLDRGLLADVAGPASSASPASPSAPASPALAAPSSQRVATASELADQLEPGASASRRRSKRPLAIGGGLVVAAGVVATIAITRRDTGYAPEVAVEGVSLTAGKRYGALLVETDGGVTPDEVSQAYQTALAALRLHVTRHRPALEVPDPVGQLVAMPSTSFCSPSIWFHLKPPNNCQSTLFITPFGPQNQHRLFVVSDRARLEEAIRGGVAQAACDFAPVDHGTPEGQKRWEEICGLTRSFLEDGSR
ncbi:MAG: serine/threonine protein kinase [Kofleriaceae bacterium]